MPNMSYCRFENTENDLKDCYAHITDKLESSYEIKARKRLIKLCITIAQDFEGVDLESLNEFCSNGDEDDECDYSDEELESIAQAFKG